uniref:CSON011798 protein n=1 Tax=Culicoides sonorensis TaxID=179676 RepID=A0A336M428_CULSO
MGRKKYFCDYCQVRIQNNPNIIKRHNEGLLHQKSKLNHFQKYKSLKEILEMERKKTPCKRALTNSCKFDMFCRFSHYSEEQLIEMEHELMRQKYAETNAEPYKRTVEDFLEERERKRVCSGFENKIYLNSSESFLPPSLQSWDLSKLPKEFTEWG